MTIKDYVKKYDTQTQFEVLINSYKQIDYAWNNDYNISASEYKNIKNVVISGLGGSAISADLISDFLGDELKLPLSVNRNYSLPSFVDTNSLVLISSYSGNTEETIEVFESALQSKCKIIAISTGGKVEKIASENNIPFVKLQKGFQPRYALGLSFFSVLKVLQLAEMIPVQNQIVKRITDLWKDKGEAYSKDGNAAFLYAEKTIGHIPLIYAAADKTSAAGYRFKCQFNENSKLHAFYHSFPEMNHNEIIGWETFAEKSLAAIVYFIMDESYHPQVKKRFDIVEDLLSKKGAEVIQLQSSETEFKVRLLDLIYLCDWITYYTGVLRGCDPTEIDYINLLKEKLA